MKSILFILCLMATTLFAFGQNYDDTKITFGLAGGSNFSTFSIKAPNQLYVEPNLAYPFSIGFNADITFNDYFSIRPSIFYQGKGSTVNEQTTIYNVADIYKLHYLEIPVDFIGHIPLNDEGTNIFLGGGPFISLGLNGTREKTINDVTTKEKLTFGRNGDFKSIDLGLTTVLGFQTASGTAVSINIDFGFSNILQNSDLNIGATSAKTGTFYLSIGQSF
jgi:hypothetical protein